MRRILLNSAMMPSPGVYQARQVSREEFVRELRSGPFESYVGYADTAKHIKHISGVTVPVNRSQVISDSPAKILVCRLSYRLADPGEKGRYVPSEDDYEYWLVDYHPEAR